MVVVASSVSEPHGTSEIELIDGPPAFDAYSTAPSCVTQQVAGCPVATEATGVSTPSGASVNVPTALGGPASATSSPPAGSKTKLNGTSPGSLLSTGLADRRPSQSTPKTSMSLPLPLVVTTSCRPSGVKPTWPGVWVNSGVSAGLSPRERVEPGIGKSRPNRR